MFYSLFLHMAHVSELMYLSCQQVHCSLDQTCRLCAQSTSHLHSDWLEPHIKHNTGISFFSKNSCNYRLQLYNLHLWDATSLQAGAAPQAAGCTWSPQGPGWAQWWQAPSHLLNTFMEQKQMLPPWPHKRQNGTQIRGLVAKVLAWLSVKINFS